MKSKSKAVSKHDRKQVGKDAVQTEPVAQLDETATDPAYEAFVNFEARERAMRIPAADVPGGAQSYTPAQLRVECGSDFLAGDAWLVLAADVADALEAHPELAELLEQEK